MFGDILTGPTAHLRAEPIMTLLPGPAGERSVPLFEHGSLIVKLYAPRGHDPQTPHTRDELYVVAQGQGTFFDGTTHRPFGPADLLFVAAGTPHRFEAFTDGFAVWVMYYGPEGGEPATERVAAGGRI